MVLHPCLPSRSSGFDSRHWFVVKIEKGPEEVLKALLSGDPVQLEEALAFQRESFKAKFGIYPEDIPWEEAEDEEHGQSGVR